MAEEKKVMNRWVVVVGAVLIQLALGAIYAWSVFTPALSADNPAALVQMYGPEQLSLKGQTPEEHSGAKQSLEDELAPIAAELKAARTQLKGEKDPAKVTALKAEASAAIEKMWPVAEKHGVADVLKGKMYKFSNEQTQYVFSAGLAAFAVIMVLAGRMMPKTGPRALALVGGLVLGAGYVLGGLFAGKSLAMLVTLVGIVGGAGIGLAYVVPIAVGMRWFPDKKGLVSGLAVAGFGFGALGWVKLGGEWGHLIGNFGLPATFIVYGVIFALLVLIGGLVMVYPPEGWKPAGWVPPQPTTGQATGTVDFTSSQMLAKPQFYMIFFTFLFGAAAGLMTIGLMKQYPIIALTENGLTDKAASAVAGTAMAVFFSLANGIGRIVWGMISDKIGRKVSVMIMCATQGLLLFAFTKMAGTPALLYLGATLLGFNFGGNFSLFPAITADTFGAKRVGQNYPWVFLSYGVGGIFGPVLGGKLGDLNNFPLAFMICAGLCIVGAVLSGLVRPPKHEASAQG